MDPHNPTNNINHGNINPQIQLPFFSDEFGIHEFVDDPQLHFDQVIIDMIRGESPHDPMINNLINIGVNANSSFDSQTLISPNLLLANDQNTNQFCGNIITPEDVFTNFNSPTISCTDSTILNPFLGFEDELMIKRGGEDEDEDDEDDNEEDSNYGEAEHSSATATTTTTTTATKKGKVDRSRTLISERRRRGTMKEKLYALRALVPNITKMDKASIVGDAVLYLQDLQITAKKLKSEVEGLESSFKAAQKIQLNNTQNKHFLIPASKTIMQMDVHQIEDRELYVKVVTNKGGGVAASLYKALESFTNFTIQSSNLTTVCDTFLLAFTLNVGILREDTSLINLKLWITGAFLNQGFEFQAF